MIKIVGLGFGVKEVLIVGIIIEFENNKNIFLRIEKYLIVDYLEEKNIKFGIYDNVYESMDSFDEVYLFIVNDLIEKYKNLGDLVYVVLGYLLVVEKLVFNLINLCKKNNIEYKVMLVVSFIDVMMEVFMIDLIEGVKVIDVFDINN